MKSEFLNIDCMEYMKDVPDKYFDLCICDPPYGINADKMQMGSGMHKFASITNKLWDNSIPDKKYFDELFRISKNQIIWGGNYFSEYLYPSPNWIVWDKLNPNLSFAEGELAWMSFGNRLRFYKKYSAIEKKIHPTQKPIQLYQWLLINYAKPGDKIFDSHVGSASSLIACHLEGFEYIGCELDPDYYKEANKRLEQYKAQGNLFQEI